MEHDFGIPVLGCSTANLCSEKFGLRQSFRRQIMLASSIAIIGAVAVGGVLATAPRDESRMQRRANATSASGRVLPAEQAERLSSTSALK
ncbi:protein of unknown function (plasmid) [Caballeronia sp. S22]